MYSVNSEIFKNSIMIMPTYHHRNLKMSKQVYDTFCVSIVGGSCFKMGKIWHSRLGDNITFDSNRNILYYPCNDSLFWGVTKF